MPKKSSRKETIEEIVEQSDNEFQEDELVENVTCSELKTKRIYFRARPVDKEATQLMCFPKYLYDADKKATPENFEKYGRNLIVLTKPIKITRGGVPKHNTKYHGPDEDSMKRAYFYVPKNEGDENSMDLFNCLNRIDEWMDDEINTKKNVNSVICYLKGESKRVKLKGITYKKMVTVAKGPSSLDLDDENEKDKNKKPFVPWERVKVKLSTLWDETLGPNDKKDIVTQIFMGNNETPENVTTVSDVERHFVWNCTAQFALHFNKVWIQKTDEMNCGIGLKCVQICVTDKPEARKSVSTQLNKRLFARSAPVVKASNDSDDDDDNNANASDNDADASDNDDSENESEVAEGPDSGENYNDVSEPESEEEEPVKKKKLKVKGKNEKSSGGKKKKK